jgi:hypothetical protein
MEEQLKIIVNALVSAIVTSEVFQAAVKHEVGHAARAEVNFATDEFRDAVRTIANEVINEEDSLIMFDNEKFKRAVHDILEDFSFKDTIEDVVGNMSFNVEVSRY